MYLAFKWELLNVVYYCGPPIANCPFSSSWNVISHQEAEMHYWSCKEQSSLCYVNLSCNLSDNSSHILIGIALKNDVFPLFSVEHGFPRSMKDLFNIWEIIIFFLKSPPTRRYLLLYVMFHMISSMSCCSIYSPIAMNSAFATWICSWTYWIELTSLQRKTINFASYLYAYPSPLLLLHGFVLE